MIEGVALRVGLLVIVPVRVEVGVAAGEPLVSVAVDVADRLADGLGVAVRPLEAVGDPDGVGDLLPGVGDGAVAVAVWLGDAAGDRVVGVFGVELRMGVAVHEAVIVAVATVVGL